MCTFKLECPQAHHFDTSSFAILFEALSIVIHECL
jgi:hypothetical protein